MIQGTVKWYNETKGFGFIINEEDDKDVFVHKSGLASVRRLEEGQKVQFEISDSPKGPTAVNVEPID